MLTQSHQDLQEQISISNNLREQLEQAKKESAEKGSVRRFPLSVIYDLTLGAQANLNLPQKNRLNFNKKLRISAARTN